jgi:hypothetical protein
LRLRQVIHYQLVIKMIDRGAPQYFCLFWAKIY